MVEVRVRQDDGIDLSRGNRELLPVAQPQVLESLEQTAIHEHALAAVLEQIFRPGHRAGSTHKRQVSHRTTISGLQASGPGAASANLSAYGERVETSRRSGWQSRPGPSSLSAQSKDLLTVDAIYDPEHRVAFSGFAEDDISWLDAATYVVARQSGSGFEWLKVDATSGRTSPLFDADRMETALASLPGVTRAEAGLIARSNDLIFNATRTLILVTIADDLYFYDFCRHKSFTSHDGGRERRRGDLQSGWEARRVRARQQSLRRRCRDAT